MRKGIKQYYNKNKKNKFKYIIKINKKYLKGNKIINQEILKFIPGDRITVPGFNNEDGVVERISNRSVWIFLENLGY